MEQKQFGKRLLEVTLLLIGLKILDLVIPVLSPTMNLGDSTIFFIKYGHWIGNILFGIVMYSLTNQSKKVSFSIGFLSIVQPLLGGIFYLLTLTNNKAIT